MYTSALREVFVPFFETTEGIEIKTLSLLPAKENEGHFESNSKKNFFPLLRERKN